MSTTSFAPLLPDRCVVVSSTCFLLCFETHARYVPHVTLSVRGRGVSSWSLSFSFSFLRVVSCSTKRRHERCWRFVSPGSSLLPTANARDASVVVFVSFAHIPRRFVVLSSHESDPHPCGSGQRNERRNDPSNWSDRIDWEENPVEEWTVGSSGIHHPMVRRRPTTKRSNTNQKVKYLVDRNTKPKDMCMGTRKGP